MNDIKAVAFDLDGTLTQHKSPLGDESRALLDALAQRYHLLMIGAGTCARIRKQMGDYPIDIIGSYGMQYAAYENGDWHMVWDEQAAVDRAEVLRRAEALRQRFGLYPYAGDTLEIHPTGALTFPILGTAAQLADKLAYDPDHKKRAAMLDYVTALFPDYGVVIGGSSSFDLIPGAYGKLNALRRFLRLRGWTDAQVAYCGDDYRPGGNDHEVYAAGYFFVRVDDYRRVGQFVRDAGLLG